MLLVCVFVPLLGAGLLPLVGKFSERLRNVGSLLLVVTSLACTVGLLFVEGNGSVNVVELAGVRVLSADGLAVFMALVSALVGSIIVFYSWGYIAPYEHRNEYYFLVVLFLGSMMGLVFSSNLIALYIFWEITASASWRLIGFFREKQFIVRANKAFLITTFGALAMLVGFVEIYSRFGTFDLEKLSGTYIPSWVVGVILLGIFSKSATFPLHSWLPDAGIAPSPVTALLHAAVLVKIGVYVFARLFLATFIVSPIWQEIVPWLVAASALVCAGAALVATDLKRIIAYSTISQIGFIFLGLSVDNSLAIGGGLLYIFMHSVAKGGLFLCAGIVEHQTHNKDIRKLGGLIKTMPITAFAFAICALSVMGIPPLGGFYSKYLVIVGALKSGQVALGLVFIFGSILTILYLMRAFLKVFLGEPKNMANCPKEGTRGMVWSVAILAAIALLSGLLIKYPNELASTAVEQIARSRQ